jgi:Protein of unknown function (DUF3551)
MATPAAASPGEYCRREYGSGTLRTCPYSTMEQCQDSVSGRTGSCERNPFMPDNSNAFAYQPKHGRAISVKKPVGSQ